MHDEVLFCFYALNHGIDGEGKQNETNFIALLCSRLAMQPVFPEAQLRLALRLGVIFKVDESGRLLGSLPEHLRSAINAFHT